MSEIFTLIPIYLEQKYYSYTLSDSHILADSPNAKTML